MKRNSLLLIMGFLLLFSANSAKAQSTFTNTGNSITLSITTTDCNGFSPATGAYSMSLIYNDGSDHTYSTASVQVTSTGTPGNMTVFIDASLSTPAAAWPDLSTVNTGGFTLAQGATSFMYQFQFNQLVCAALPITLEYFHGALSGSYANLTWRTDMEQNTSVINVQRSTTGSINSFSNVGIEPAAGNSSIPINYSFTAPIVAGTNYFRLQFVDLDGRLTYSPIVLISAPAGSYPSSICSFTTLTGPATLCPGSSGIYKLHNSAPGISWSVSPTNDALSTSNGGTEATVSNNASYTGSTTLTAVTTGCTKNITINGSPTNSLSVTGPASICTGGQSYTLSNLSGVSSVTWSVSPTYTASLSVVNGFSTTLTRTGSLNGYVTLTATYTTSSCSTPVPVPKTVSIGVPAGNLSVSLSCPSLFATASNAPGATTYEWHLVDMNTFSETITNGGSSFSASIGGGHSWNVGYAYTNACGKSDPAVNYGYVCTGGTGGGGGGGTGHVIKISPNPSPGIITVGMQTVPPSTLAAAAGSVTPAYAGFGPANRGASVQGGVVSEQAGATIQQRPAPAPISLPAGKALIYQIRVMDKAGNLRKTFNYPGGVESISVDLSGLPGDLYTLQVYDSKDNKTWTTQQVMLAK